MNEPQHDTQLLTGIRLGLRKARELGYAVERMDITASVSKGICVVHFAPIPEPGFVTAGGDLSVFIDPRAEEVIEYRRGQ